MHIHGNSFNINAANLYSAAQGHEAAVAARRAAEVRKKLLNSAGLDSDVSPEEALLIGQWTNARLGQTLPGDECRSAPEGRDPDSRAC